MSPASRKAQAKSGAGAVSADADGVAERVGAFVDVGDAAVEAQLGDVVGDIGQRAVRRLAHRQRLLAELRPAARPAR